MNLLESNNLEIFRRLLDNGLVNDSSIFGFTALMCATEVHGTNLEIIDSLIKRGANINFKNSKNQSAYSLACLHNNYGVAQFLLNHEVKIIEYHYKSNIEMIEAQLNQKTLKISSTEYQQFYRLEEEDKKIKETENDSEINAAIRFIRVYSCESGWIRLGISILDQKSSGSGQHFLKSRTHTHTFLPTGASKPRSSLP